MPITWSYPVLYSTQLTRKHRTWSDGTLHYQPATRTACLLNEKGKAIERVNAVSAADLVKDKEWFMEQHVLMLQGDQPSTVVQEDEICKEEKPNTIEAAKSIRYGILYTADKHKKQNRRWLEGHAMVEGGQACLFYDEHGRLIHRTSQFPLEVIETPRLLIEITEQQDTEQHEQTPPNLAIGFYEILYTADKHKKQNRRWLDGYVEVTDDAALFYSQEHRLIHRRKKGGLSETELTTAEWLIQIGNRLAGGRPSRQEEQENLEIPLEWFCPEAKAAAAAKRQPKRAPPPPTKKIRREDGIPIGKEGEISADSAKQGRSIEEIASLLHLPPPN